MGWPHKGALHPGNIFEGFPGVIHRLVGQVEVCPKTQHEHYQIFVQFVKKKRYTAISKMFPFGQWVSMAQKYGGAEEMESYCTKTKTRKAGCEPFFYGDELILERKSSKLALAIAALKGGASLRQVAIDHSEVWVRHNRGLTDLHVKINTPVHTPAFQLTSFKWPPITDWSNSHVFWGLPGIGKTEFALAHFKAPLVVSHPDDLRQFDQTVHDGIVFDDMEFDYQPKSANINITDQTLPRSIHCRYTTALIPAHTHKIFTTNNDHGLIFKDQDRKWIRRRIHVTHLAGQGWNPSDSSIEED